MNDVIFITSRVRTGRFYYRQERRSEGNAKENFALSWRPSFLGG